MQRWRISLERADQPSAICTRATACGKVRAESYPALGRRHDAYWVLEHGRRWVVALAAQHVPEAFRSSFLQRNAVNAALLALAQHP